MRFVQKNIRPNPDTLASAETQAFLSKICYDTIDSRKKILKSKDAAPYWKGKYEENGIVKYAVVQALEDLYFGKCAYCERHCQTEIEHYRPKGAVKEDISHGGYYWLAYEWTNLLLACHDCNEMIHGKGTKFPIKVSHRATIPLTNGTLDSIKCEINHSHLTSEQPFLLHPEVDNPENLFTFEWDNIGIVMKSKDSQIPNRASETIRICNLNRDSLKNHRAEVVKEEIIQNINHGLCMISQFDVDEETIILAIEPLFKKLQDKISDNGLTFTLLRKFILENEQNFKDLIIPYIEKKYKNLIMNAFTYFKTQTL